MAESLRIVALSVLSAVAYGVLCDQVAVRVSLDSYAVGHA